MVLYRTNRDVIIDDMRLNEREDTFVFYCLLSTIILNYK